MAHRFDAVAVRVEDEGGIIAVVIVRAETGTAVVPSTRREGVAVEEIDRLTARRLETPMAPIGNHAIRRYNGDVGSLAVLWPAPYPVADAVLARLDPRDARDARIGTRPRCQCDGVAVETRDTGIRTGLRRSR